MLLILNYNWFSIHFNLKNFKWITKTPIYWKKTRLYTSATSSVYNNDSTDTEIETETETTNLE